MLCIFSSVNDIGPNRGKPFKMWWVKKIKQTQLKVKRKKPHIYDEPAWSDLWKPTDCLTPSCSPSFFYSFLLQFLSSCPSWWCHILWSLPAWRQPPFPWRWARWTDRACWPAWPTWRISTPTPLPGLPPPSLRWTQRPISPVDLTTSQ